VLLQRIKELFDRQAHLPLLLGGILGLLIFYSILKSIQFFYNEFQGSNQVINANKKNGIETSDVLSQESQTNIVAAASNLHLFGHSLSTSKDIPLSALNLKLTGIFFGDTEKDSKASIIYNEQAEKLYGINDTLPNGVVVERIFPNEVIIKYNGELQKLTLFPKNE
jgi:type II secretory pathway component PulC